MSDETIEVTEPACIEPVVPEEAKQQLGFFDGNPKMIFVFGLVAGIALTYIGGDIMNGASRGVIAAAPTVIADNTDPDPTPPVVAGKLAAVTATDHIRGDIKKAKVVMIEYSDYECPFCGRHNPTMQQLSEKYGDDVAWVLRHFPLSFHPEAMPAANAAECANEQGKFWEFTDIMYANQDSLSSDYYGQVADQLKLNRNKFDDCVKTKKYQSVIDADAATGRTAGVNGTPATFIDGQLISGAVPIDTFTQLIDAALAK
jgi:protein-disulfide isomerase